jgi:hypothetical protein
MASCFRGRLPKTGSMIDLLAVVMAGLRLLTATKLSPFSRECAVIMKTRGALSYHNVMSTSPTIIGVIDPYVCLTLSLFSNSYHRISLAFLRVVPIAATPKSFRNKANRGWLTNRLLRNKSHE